MSIKVGDKIQVMTGRDQGQTGTVLRVDRKRDRVLVEGLNLVKRHQRTGPDGTEGGIIEKEAFIHASNVLLFSEKLERGVRTQSRYVGQDRKYFASRSEAQATFAQTPKTLKKVRFCVKTEEVFE